MTVRLSTTPGALDFFDHFPARCAAIFLTLDLSLEKSLLFRMRRSVGRRVADDQRSHNS